jgi:hypothetical protein
VLDLGRGLSAPFEAIAEALDDAPAPPSRPPRRPERHDGPVLISAGKVTVHTVPAEAAAASTPAGAPLARPPNHGGPTDPPDERTRLTRLRAAVHAFADHWADRPRRLAEMRAARRLLTRSSLPISGGGH